MLTQDTVPKALTEPGVLTAKLAACCQSDQVEHTNIPTDAFCFPVASTEAHHLSLLQRVHSYPS